MNLCREFSVMEIICDIPVTGHCYLVVVLMLVDSCIYGSGDIVMHWTSNKR